MRGYKGVSTEEREWDMAIDPKTGWADNRLMKAHGILWDVLSEISSEEDCYESVKEALDAIETADVALEAR